MKKLGWKKDAKVGKSDSIVAYGPEETVAYAHYFMPSRYFSVLHRIISHHIISHHITSAEVELKVSFYFVF